MKKISNTDTKKLENLYKLNKIDELEQETKKLLAIDKNNAILLNKLGVAYLKKKIFNKAEEIFKKILNHDSQDANALKNLGKTYKEINKIGYAIKYYEKYLAIKSNDSEIKNNLALCYIKNKKSKLALDLLKELIKKDSENQEYLINYSVALFESLSFNEAITILEKLLDKNLKNSNILSKYLFNQNYNADINFDKVNNYINKFYQSYNKENFKINSFCFNKKPEKINLGFVSPDFRNHPVGYALTDVINNLKSYNFNLFGYYNFTLEDELTIKFKKDFNSFYNITDLTDEQTINKIRSDGIHILIDLAGYTFNNRLSIFFFNPAPIQISWLGYLPTTGLNEMQYKIGDQYIYPDSIKKNFSEEILLLPNIWSNFSVQQNIVNKKVLFPDENGPVIFGCFATLRKVNDEVINLWSKVLKKFPNTKIYFKSPELNDVSVKELIKNKFLKHDIKSDRLILEKSSDYKNYLESYSKVHISLDPFPWNGVTTSFESIWMGVPIFCLKGNTLPYSRCAYSINKNLKMNDWIAENENDYFNKLKTILSDRKKLFLVKKHLRENAIKNYLFSSKEFTKNLAKILNKTWENFSVK